MVDDNLHTRRGVDNQSKSVLVLFDLKGKAMFYLKVSKKDSSPKNKNDPMI